MRFRKKPVEIDAEQFTDPKNPPDAVCDCADFADKGFHIHTNEGIMKAPLNYWVITGVAGEKYSCEPGIFDKTYEKVTGPKAVLMFDTETNGLPKDYKAPARPDDNYPRMLQLAWVVYDRYGNLISETSRIVKPEGFAVNPEAAAIHKITQERADTEGLPLKRVLCEFARDWYSCSDIVCHNLDFDQKVVASEQMRAGLYDGTMRKAFHCTMKGSTKICKLPGKFCYKWPTLTELHTHLFGKGFEEAHDALVDVKALARCFWKLKDTRKISMSFAFENPELFKLFTQPGKEALV